MRVNVYAEELTDRVEIISKKIDGRTYTGLRIYLELPVTVRRANIPGPESAEVNPTVEQIRGPFMHRPGDDDSAAITFWGKADLRDVLKKALRVLDKYYEERDGQKPDVVVHKYRLNTTGVLCGARSGAATTSSNRTHTTCEACLRLWSEL